MELVTVSDIATQLEQPVKRVRYVLETRPDIRPLRRVGIARVFGRDVVDRVRQELERIDARRKGAAVVA